MTPRQIEAFRAVVQTGGVTAAAQRLRVSQPAVSRILRDFEAELGFALFERHKGRVHPTSAGLTLLAEVERAFIGLDRLALIGREIRERRRGRLRIGCMPALAHSLLPRAIAAFMRARQSVELRVLIDSSAAIRQQLLDRQIDLGLTVGNVAGAGVRTIARLRAPAVCVIPAAHRLAAKRIVTPRDLADEAFISLGAGTPTRHRIDAVFDEARVSRQLGIEVTLSATACQLVAAGLGVAIVDSLMAEAFRDHGVAWRPFKPRIGFDYNVVQPLPQLGEPLGESFVAALREALPTGLAMI